MTCIVKLFRSSLSHERKEMLCGTYLDNDRRDHFARTAPSCVEVDHHKLRAGGGQLRLEVVHVGDLVNHDEGYFRPDGPARLLEEGIVFDVPRFGGR